MDLVATVQNELIRELGESLNRAQKAGELRFKTIPSFVVEVPREKGHGDFATNLAMLMAKQARKSPREIAAVIVRYLEPEKIGLKKVEVAGPGFINFYLETGWTSKVLLQALSQNENFGKSKAADPQKIQVEFVSANPTGLLHMGNARGAALGDVIANLLEATGHDVAREFYVNDAGNQILVFGETLEARYLQQFGRDVSLPEQGYHGADIVDTVRRFTKKFGNRYLNEDDIVRREALVNFALEEKIAQMKRSLENFGVFYDCWFSERVLHESGAIKSVVKELQEMDCIYEQEGALWFRSSSFGDEKDEVLIRANGFPTYFAADIAYHQDKFRRGFDRAINIWGADHHGHIARMKGAMKALGYEPERLQIVIMQLVRLFQGGELLRMSKRTGRYVTLDELVEEVGVDAARYFFVMRSADSHLDFDLDLARTESADNPVYYVQYAHARICSILRQAAQQGLTMPDPQHLDYTILKTSEEQKLIRKIADFPGLVRGAAEALEPHRLTSYAHELASLFHSFYNTCRVLTDSEELTGARLILVQAARITLRNLLTLLGVNAPQKM